MSELIQKERNLVSGKTILVPEIIAHAGEDASKRFIEFFTAQIRNKNTRLAYGRAVMDFVSWCEENAIGPLIDIEPIHIAAWVEKRITEASAPTVKQNLAAVRHLFDWLVTGQILPSNPATSVRGPKHVVQKGKTPVLTPEEARQLLDSIPIDTLVGVRDRAFIALMTYSFARVSAAVQVNVGDIFTQRHRLWIRLHEKGGKYHEMPCHHSLEEYLRAYMGAAGLEDKTTPLFCTIDRKTKTLSNRRLNRTEAWYLVKRRAKAADISTEVCNHTFRGTGITAYLSNDTSKLELAQQMAGHADPKTTKLYDRRSDEISLDEVEKIGI